MLEDLHLQRWAKTVAPDADLAGGVARPQLEEGGAVVIQDACLDRVLADHNVNAVAWVRRTSLAALGSGRPRQQAAGGELFTRLRTPGLLELTAG